MEAPNPESRAVRWLQSAEVDPQNGNLTLQGPGPGGFRVFVPPAVAPGIAPTGGSCPVEGGEFTHSSGRNYAGEFTPLFRGRVVFGPQPKRFFASIVVFMVVLIILSIQAPDIIREFGDGTVALGFLLHLLAIVSFFIICSSDPGVIPQNYRLCELIWDTEDYRSRNPEARFYTYCDNCRGFRPPKSKHCHECNICIRDHETHLIVGGTCVGQKTARSMIILSLTVGLFSLYLIVVNSVILHNPPPYMQDWRKGVAIASLALGILLILVPQVGIILFLFRVFLVGMGYTGSSFIHRNNDSITCPVDQRSVPRNYIAFFFGKRSPSIFRKKERQVQPEAGNARGEHADEDWISLISLPAHGLPLLQELFRLRDEELLSLQSEQRRRRHANFLQNLNNNNSASPQLREEIEAMIQVADAARPKSIPSDPQLYSGELDTLPSQRFRRGIKSRLSDTLQQRMVDCQRLRNKSPRNVGGRCSSASLLALEPATLSEGSIPQAEESGGTRGVVNTARAQQYRRLIKLVLTRDRAGLIEMGRTVNLPALLGVRHFDPDNFQFVETSNGLPMIALRRAQGYPQGRNLFGVSALVASGLLPPARQLAAELEGTIGRGSVRRTPRTDHYVYDAMRQNRYPQRTFPRRESRLFGSALDFPLLDTNPRLLSLFGVGGARLQEREQGREREGRGRERDRGSRRRSCPTPRAPTEGRSTLVVEPSPTPGQPSTPPAASWQTVINALLDDHNNNEDESEASEG